MRVILASKSPRRRELLRAAGLDVDVRTAPCDESPLDGEHPLTYVKRVAAAKLDTARASHSHLHPDLHDLPWIAADTIVCAPQGTLFGKPITRAEAETMLLTLTEGHPHTVHTGWALAWGDERERHVETTTVEMRPLTTTERDAYLNTDAWRDKAGGYGIQGHAAAWVTRIEGSYTNVVGLPVAQVFARLARGRSS